MKHTYLIALLLLVPLVAAHGDDEAFTLELEMHDDQTFTFAGKSEANPDLKLAAGASYNIIVTNAGTAMSHDLNIDLDGDGEADITTDLEDGNDLQPGESVTLHFTVPASAVGTAEYWCNPHFPQMMGSVIFVKDEHDDGQDSPGIAMLGLLGAMGALALLRRK